MIALNPFPKSPQQRLRFKVVPTLSGLSSSIGRRVTVIKGVLNALKIAKPQTRSRSQTPISSLPRTSSCDSRPAGLREYLLAALHISQPEKGSETTSAQKALDQAQSGLFKLPYEIRELIRREVLGDETLHITHLENRIAYARCSYPTEQKWSTSTHDCWGKECYYTASKRSPSVYAGPIYGYEEPRSLLALPRTCKAIYSESINLLYGSNKFDFRFPHTVLSFCSIVPPHSLNCINSLHLTCDIWNLVNPDPNLPLDYRAFIPQSWPDKTNLEGVFHVIGGLEGLRVLQIEHQNRERSSLGNHAYEFSRNINSKLKQALCSITQAETLEVKIPWTSGDIRKDVGLLDNSFKPQDGTPHVD